MLQSMGSQTIGPTEQLNINTHLDRGVPLDVCWAKINPSSGTTFPSLS